MTEETIAQSLQRQSDFYSVNDRTVEAREEDE